MSELDLAIQLQEIRPMYLGSIDLSTRRVLIAELGNNHEGDAETAHRMVDSACDAGVDAVKIQIIQPRRLVHPSQTERIAQLERFKLSSSTIIELAQHTRERGKLFVASVFDCESMEEWVDALDVIKIASGDLDFHRMLRVATAAGKPLVLSTGMASMDEIRESVEVVRRSLPDGIEASSRLCLLHCVSLYPTPIEQANLSVIPTLRKTFGLTVGYSDHTLGAEAAIAALALGARVIEKHFTLDKTKTTFRDHALSLEPTEFAELARITHVMDMTLGGNDQSPVRADAPSRMSVRRSIVAARELEAGTVLQADDIDFIRPASELSPSEELRIVGRTLKRKLAAYEPLQKSDFI